MEFAAKKVSEEKLVISDLSEKLNEYEANLPLDREENTLMENTRQELEEKTLERIRGIMLRSKAKWYEQGGKEY